MKTWWQTEVLCSDCLALNQHRLSKETRCYICGGFRSKWVAIKWKKENFFKKPEILTVLPYDGYPNSVLEELSKLLDLEECTRGECSNVDFLKAMIDEAIKTVINRTPQIKMSYQDSVRIFEKFIKGQE